VLSPLRACLPPWCFCHGSRLLQAAAAVASQDWVVLSLGKPPLHLQISPSSLNTVLLTL